MKLRFYAKDDLLVMKPGIHLKVGSPNQYVGRKHDPQNHCYPATKEPYECDRESADGRRLIKITKRDNSLYPADKETAAACGLPFLNLEFQNGYWNPQSKRKEPKIKEQSIS